MDKMEALANDLPAGTTWAWSGMSLQEKLASGQAMSLYAISILVVSCASRRCMRAGRCRSR
ncbi:RND efflux system, inner membrane transporter CmeB [Klebsiella grimontii]|uniref:RND efflux system, inner membrane transporter CmeB n=1 Tax=Klebsiella grimontii TaxID=2058152 RepID=A0A7H4NU94_9ENTR|nr:RND efflux system, inner membrane transporter CmeB [Klebsiella grimontii]